MKLSSGMIISGFILLCLLFITSGILLLLYSDGQIGKQPESFLGKFLSAYFGMTFINIGLYPVILVLQS